MWVGKYKEFLIKITRENIKTIRTEIPQYFHEVSNNIVKSIKNTGNNIREYGDIITTDEFKIFLGMLGMYYSSIVTFTYILEWKPVQIVFYLILFIISYIITIYGKFKLSQFKNE